MIFKYMPLKLDVIRQLGTLRNSENLEAGFRLLIYVLLQRPHYVDKDM